MLFHVPDSTVSLAFLLQNCRPALLVVNMVMLSHSGGQLVLVQLSTYKLVHFLIAFIHANQVICK